jgi:hypothetical protein
VIGKSQSVDMIRKLPFKASIALLMMAAVTLCLVSCSEPPTPSQASTSVSTPVSTPASSVSRTYSQYQLGYQLLANYPDIFWCDSDFYPVAREGQEQTNAVQQFSDIKANSLEFSAILEHLALPNTADYSDLDKLNIYRQHKILTRAISLSPSDNHYDFNLRTGKSQGWSVGGTITASGQIKELKKDPSFNTCPICLTWGTLIETPGGPVPVEQLKPGMEVWTQDKTGHRLPAPLIKTAGTPVPASFQVLLLTLEDGRSVAASPGHPTAVRKAIGDYHIGDYLDHSPIVSIQKLDYAEGATYDLLPDAGTGLYWANGILLMSTLY